MLPFELCRIVSRHSLPSLSCEHRGEPFIHQIAYRDIVPEHLEPSDSELKALADNGLGELKT
jgi:hypothetical protein